MKKLFILIIFFSSCSLFLFAQGKSINTSIYPVPEFNNEVNFINKEDMTLRRLEKGSSKMESKAKMGGMGGGESGYTMEGNKSFVRLPGGNNLSFIFYNGSNTSSSHQTDSIMRANGMDPTVMKNNMEMMTDPSRNTTLYSMNEEKGNRKITVMAYQGMKLFGKSKKESTKYSLSVKKIRDGYYELIVDKPLPKGEYAFVKMDFGNADGSYSLFAFGID
ncbi:MAG: hypothetical protein ABI416_06575 [Ginsengibacter sp.]